MENNTIQQPNILQPPNMVPNQMQPPNMVPNQMQPPNMMPNQMQPPNMVSNQMYPSPYYYQHYMAMNQGMVPPYHQMGYQFPPGYQQMGMQYMNPQNNMSLENGNNLQPGLDNTVIQPNPQDENKIRDVKPLKVIRKVNKNDKTNVEKQKLSSSSEGETKLDTNEKNDVKIKEENSKIVTKSNEKTGINKRIDFNVSDDEKPDMLINVKAQISAIPNEKVEEDVKKKEEIIAKEMTEKEILMKKIKNQKALDEIKMDKNKLKILVRIAKKLPKKNSRLLRTKFKWKLLEKVKFIY